MICIMIQLRKSAGVSVAGIAGRTLSISLRCSNRDKPMKAVSANVQTSGASARCREDAIEDDGARPRPLSYSVPSVQHGFRRVVWIHS
jgi:hypothetical protein